jgi:DNA polymerase I-like protein with 3'-5' exonuclease and polymerase domains
MKPIVLDFETLGILPRPHYPPEPVSLSVKLPEWRGPKFFAWGHRTGGNNCTKADAARVLRDVWARLSEATPLLMHNAKFDLDVAEAHFKLPLPDWRCVHDTMFLLFLDDPHQRSLGLKPSAERLLGLPPEERDAVKDWILVNKKRLEAEFPEILRDHGTIKPSNTGAFIAYAPGTIVGPYANGDVTRTLKLFDALHKDVVVTRGMRAAYDRERQLLPILLRNEREGVAVDRTALERDLAVYEAAQAKTDAWLRKALKAPGLDLDKDADMAAALKAVDAVTEWHQTPTGRDSVSKRHLKLSHFRDAKVAAAYGYRQKCATVLETFIRPWLSFSAGGRMHTTWNQVRQSKGASTTGGTRTGRPSTDSPNFLNMPKAVEDNADKGFIMPTHIRDLPLLPRVRGYILPDDKKSVVGRRDFNQQEVRVLAHFEDGALLRAYLENPRLDVHEFTRQSILELLGLDVGRSVTKTLLFGYIYGQGLGSLAEKLDRSVDEVRGIRAAQMTVLPGLKDLSSALKDLAKRDEPMRTWGGRQYYVEPPQLINGRMQSFEYKLINYLCQGSAADVTKESIIRYDALRREGRFMLSVYDENNISVPKAAHKSEMLILRDVMMSIELDVPLLSDGEVGPNLGTLTALREPAPDLSRWTNRLEGAY